MSSLVEPADAHGIADTLARASRERTSVTIRGGGTKTEWGRPPDGVHPDGVRPEIVLSTRRLNAIVAHRHGDLTATIEAGGVLDDVNRELARRGQWIPVDPPWPDRATIGGIVATNDSGPRRQRYGAPRDLIIGMELARADGVIAKAGGIVVKNVAGYDVARLITGSYGSLGVIVSATFKLYPLPESSSTVLVEAGSHRTNGAILESLARSQLTPTAIELHSPPPRLLIRFESIAPSVKTQTEQAARLAESTGAVAAIVRGDDEAARWAEHARLWERPGAIVKMTLVPSEMMTTLDRVADGSSAGGVVQEIAGRAGLGVLFLRLDGPVEAQSRLVSGLRERFSPGRGSVVLLRASDELKRSVGVWGPMGDGFKVMQAVKRAFDPAGTLNPGRGPGGL